MSRTLAKERQLNISHYGRWENPKITNYLAGYQVLTH